MREASTKRSERFPGWDRPPAEFRPAVLWSWNGDMSPDRIRKMLEGFSSRNIGGVFIHPRPGLVTEYLSEQWFSLWGVALEESKRLGIGCHIYDENSFPSGFAGGHVVAGNPLAATSRLTGRWVLDFKKSGRSSHLALLSRDPATGATVACGERAISSPSSTSPILALDLEKSQPDLWHGGFPMADVCRAEVTGRFLECTHAAYAARFSHEFGETIRYVFTDEPETGTSDKGFHMSQAFLHAFRAEHGYPLESCFPQLCGSHPDSPGVRHDYFFTLNRLFTENFARCCHDWCADHHLSFTGHFLEDKWPFPTGLPDTMAAQRWMHAPGIDLLGFQFSDGGIRPNALWLLTLKEATSIAAQCGRAEVLCESSGGGGYGFGPAEMKPLEDFLLALGVNRIVPHLAHESLAGVRKYDWPQTISDHSPWWDAFGAHALHIARANYLLSQGEEINRTLVLHPTTTGWLHYRPACFHWPGETLHTMLDSLRQSYTAFLADLYSAGVDFDLGDEWVMAEMGSATNADGKGSLKVGSRSYQTIVVPAGMENMLSSTVRILGDFLSAGGTILSAGEAPTFLDGRLSAFPLASSPRWMACGATLIARLRERHTPRLASPDGEPLPADLLWRHSALPEGGGIVFFSNPTAAPISAEIALNGNGIVAYDTLTGSRSVLAGKDQKSARLSLPPGGHALWRLLCEPPAESIARPEWLSVPAQFLGCSPVEENLLALDYCGYSGPHTEIANTDTLHADSENWHAQGFEQNLWRVSIQYRRTFLDARIPGGSGFSVRYPFHLSEDFAACDASKALRVAVERPWLYEIFCNGSPLCQEGASAWFDEDVFLLPIGGAATGGANLIELRAREFHVLAEISPIFLRGQFRAVPHENGFLLEPLLPWGNGADWRAAGYPFYPWRVRYQYAIRTGSPGFLRITLPEFSGSAAGVQLDEGPPIWGFRPGQTMEFSAPPGDHHLDLLLCGNLKNLLGPHFSEGLPGAWSWEDCPPTQPAGGKYRFFPTGLAGSPSVEFQDRGSSSRRWRDW